MRTTMRTWTTLLTCVFLFTTSGCATRYQQMLQDRDAEIRDLEGQLAGLRSSNEDLRRQKDAAESRANALQSSTVDASSNDDDELARVQNDLPDLDVRYDRAGRISIGIENTVTFDPGSVALKKDAGNVLSRVANVLRRDYSDRRIYVEGHTDSDPIRKTKALYRSNRHLSSERADAVAAYLVGKGRIPGNQIVIVGYGPHSPRVNGSNDTAKARNRRVEVVVGESL